MIEKIWQHTKDSYENSNIQIYRNLVIVYLAIVIVHIAGRAIM